MPRHRPDAATRALLRATRTITVQRGQRVLSQGDLDGAVYLVTSGKIKMVGQTASGSESVLAVLGPGRMFGELSPHDDGDPGSASAQALTSATLQELTQPRLRELIDERPELAQWLLQQFARLLRQASDLAANLVLRDVPTRVAQILVSLAGDFGTEAADGVRVEHGLTQLELAQLVGAARESVNKALAGFVSAGWLTLTSRSVLIHDLDALRHRAGQHQARWPAPDFSGRSSSASARSSAPPAP